MARLRPRTVVILQEDGSFLKRVEPNIAPKIPLVLSIKTRKRA